MLIIAIITTRIESIDPKIKTLIGRLILVNGKVVSSFKKEIAIICKQNKHKPNITTNFAIFPIFSTLFYVFNQVKLFKNIVKKTTPYENRVFDKGDLMGSKKTLDYLENKCSI